MGFPGTSDFKAFCRIFRPCFLSSQNSFSLIDATRPFRSFPLASGLQGGLAGFWKNNLTLNLSTLDSNFFNIRPVHPMNHITLIPRYKMLTQSLNLFLNEHSRQEKLFKAFHRLIIFCNSFPLIVHSIGSLNKYSFQDYSENSQSTWKGNQAERITSNYCLPFDCFLLFSFKLLWSH